MDELDRPDRIDDRLGAYAACLDMEALSASTSNLSAMAFWDESLSSTLGLAVETLGFSRTPDGPRAASVDAAILDLRRTGRLTRDAAVDGEASEALRATPEVLAAGRTALGSPWGRRLSSFVSGLTSGETTGIDDDSADVRALVLMDPAYLVGWGEEGPGRRVDMAAFDKSLAGATGSAAEACMRLWMAAASGPMEPTMDMAASAYGMYVATRATSTTPSFAGREYLEARASLRVREPRAERGGQTLVEAVFLMGDVEVAWATFEPRVRVEETFAPQGPERVEIQDGTLLHFKVAPEYRRRSLGKVVLRHAMARGCVRSVAPTRDALGLLTRHGNARADGGYDLLAPRWPAVDAVGSKVSLKNRLEDVTELDR